MDEEMKKPNPHPRKKANFLSVLFFGYTFGTFKIGRKSSWNDKNLYDPLENHRSRLLGDEIERLWFNYTEKCKLRKMKPGIVKILFKMFWPDILSDACLLIISLINRILQPFLLGMFLNYFNPRPNLTTSEASWYMICLIFLNGIMTFLSTQFKLSSSITAMKIRISCGTLLYRKVLKSSISALQEEDRGNILNLISNDLCRFNHQSFYVHYLWGSPVFILSIIYLLYVDAGLPGLVGVIWYMLYMFPQSFSARLTGSYRNKIAKRTDARIKLMNEILTGIRVIKMYAWEKPFCNLVKVARKSELDVLKRVAYMKGIFDSLLTFANIMAIFVGMLTMVLLKHEITTAKVFSLVMYYNSFNFVITLMFPLSIMKATELHEVLKRVNDFMIGEELIGNERSDDRKTKIVLRNISAGWKLKRKSKYHDSSATNDNPDEILLMKGYETKIVLENINMSLESGEFVGVAGPVGSGKSSLLLTILGETFTSGFLSVNGSIAYVSQDPWIFVGTIKQNIIFDQPFDEERYMEVIKICALEKDLDLLPNRDMTLVGERGASLSGGQKSRINLARAIYKDVDIYLFDDPLSSLDSQVSNYLVKECFHGFLKDKCRVLTSHNIQNLRNCNHVIILKSGTIEKQGSFEEISKASSLTIQSPDKIGIPDKNREKWNKKSVEKEWKSSKREEGTILKPIENKKHKSSLFTYITSGNNLCWILLVSFLFFFSQISQSSVFIFISYWAHIEETRNSTIISTMPAENMLLLESYNYMYIFIVLLLVVLLSSILRALSYARITLRSSKKLHENILHSVIKSRVSFFDEIDSGQILTRFSKDIGAVDEMLPKIIMESTTVVLILIAQIFIIAFLNPPMIIIMVFTTVLLAYFIKMFVLTSRNIRQIEGSLMGPVLTQINATIQGLCTIRATRAQNLINDEFNRHQDRYTSSYFMLNTVTHAFSFAVEFMTFIFISFVTVSCFLMRNEIGLNASEIGLAITQSLAFTTYLQFGIIQSVQVYNNLVAVERIVEYEDLPREPEIFPVEPIPKSWPECGSIHFENVHVRYHEDSIPVLKDLSFIIEAKEKIGIVGRTGAGKSTTIAAILRLALVTGKITIDSYNTEDIPLEILRSRIGVIPQDPLLFSGTLRYNLDPFQEFDDHILNEALKDVDLSEVSTDLKDLDDQIKEGGANLSVGQRQLICLARTIIRRNKIIILDEATSNMDSVTDCLIQKTIRKKFAECTVLTIAHRLSTVIDSDRIMVIESGKIIQFDRPVILLQDFHGKFYKMFNQTE